MAKGSHLSLLVALLGCSISRVVGANDDEHDGGEHDGPPSYNAQPVEIPSNPGYYGIT